MPVNHEYMTLRGCIPRRLVTSGRLCNVINTYLGTSGYLLILCIVMIDMSSFKKNLRHICAEYNLGTCLDGMESVD